jgi:hypothetical protein
MHEERERTLALDQVTALTQATEVCDDLDLQGVEVREDWRGADTNTTVAGREVQHATAGLDTVCNERCTLHASMVVKSGNVDGSSKPSVGMMQN